MYYLFLKNINKIKQRMIMNSLNNTHSRWTPEEEATFARLRAEMHSPEGQATFARLRAEMYSPEGQATFARLRAEMNSPEGQATFARLRAEMQARKNNTGNQPSMFPAEEAAPVMKSPAREVETLESDDLPSSSHSEVDVAEESSLSPTGEMDQHAVQMHIMIAQQAAQRALDASRQALETANQALQMHMDMANQAMQIHQMHVQMSIMHQF